MIPFKKMHGLGNDFVVIDARQNDVRLTPQQSMRISNRKHGVGCDQILIMRPARDATAECYMEKIEPDGTVDSTCGNGTRCIARLLMDEIGQKTARIETGAGVLLAEDIGGDLIRVNMGAPKMEWQDIPLSREVDTLNILFPEFPELAAAVCVSVGNPHAVFFVDDAEKIDLATIGPKIENHKLFPARTNVEFCTMKDAQNIRMRVWERGAGVTAACGSGACAVLVAAIRRGLVKDYADIHLDGGILRIEWAGGGNGVLMTGPTALSFSGIIDLCLLSSGA